MSFSNGPDSYDGEAEEKSSDLIETGLSDNIPKVVRRRASLEPKINTRKRQTNSKNWRAHVAKERRNKGLPYTSVRGKEVAGRSIKPGCGDKCQKRCHKIFNENIRKIHFSSFWKIADHSRQYDFIARTVHKIPVTRRTTDFDSSRRNFTLGYHLIKGGELVKCCKTMYLHTLDISAQFVMTTMKKLEKKVFLSETETDTVPTDAITVTPDKRGKHLRRGRVIPELVKQSVIAHINKFPTVEAHYVRESSTRLYLDEHLSVRKMHGMYLIEQEAKEQKAASLRQYQDIFNSNFNYSFFSPKKDQCDVCLRWKNMSSEEKEDPNTLETYTKHIANKQRSRELKEADVKQAKDGASPDPDLPPRDPGERTYVNLPKSMREVCVATYDLEKVLYVPKGENAAFWYLSKLSVYNFTVFEMVSKEGYCYVWDQTTGKKGAIEIASCVWNFIRRKVAQGVLKFIFYSDNCVPQNKNSILFSMYLLACRKFGISIEHRYLEKGHTQMECDSMHARIEAKSRNVTVYVPAQWYGLIRSAKVTKPAYVLKEMSQSDILDFNEVASFHSMASIPISKLREVVVESGNPGHIKYKVDYDSPHIIEEVFIRAAGRPINWQTYLPPAAYKEKFAVKLKLLKGLLKLCEKDIPAAYHYFYNALTPEEAPELPLLKQPAQPKPTTGQKKKNKKRVTKAKK